MLTRPPKLLREIDNRLGDSIKDLYMTHQYDDGTYQELIKNFRDIIEVIEDNLNNMEKIYVDSTQELL